MESKELIFIGLGRMGLAMATHLIEQGYTVHGFDPSQEARTEAAQVGVQIYDSVEETVNAQATPKLVWLMIPAKFVDNSIAEIKPLLSAGDTIIDGGNSFFQDTLRRHDELEQLEINYIDCGTSGGVTGARYGASLMVGGDQDVVSQYEDLFKALAIENGYGHVGGPGAGHFVKMVHNGIEYGMMGAIAEGINVLKKHEDDLHISLDEVLKPYEHGSIITSNLMSWLVTAYNTPGYLESIAGEVPKGETEGEMEFIVEHEEVRVLNAALEQRRATREQPSYIGTLISAMRNQFGGHKVIEKDNGDQTNT